MNLFSWSNVILKPLKVNKKMIEPLTYEHIKRKLGIHLSEINKSESSTKEKRKKSSSDGEGGDSGSGSDKITKRKKSSSNNREGDDNDSECDDEMKEKKTSSVHEGDGNESEGGKDKRKNVSFEDSEDEDGLFTTKKGRKIMAIDSDVDTNNVSVASLDITF